MKMSSLQILAIAAPTAGAAVFEVGLMLWGGKPITWPEVLGRVAVMAVASVAFSAVMFSLIERMNAAIRSERKRLEAMFESSSEAVLLVNHELEITALNPAAEAMLGYPARPGELKLCHLCVPPEGSSCRDGCPLDLSRPRPFFESVVRHKGGGLLPVAVSTSALPPGEDGQAESMLTLVDISRHREKEHARLSRLLTQKTMEAQEEERRRLARELHDGVAQELYGLKLAARMGTPVEDKISEIMDGVGRLAKSLWPPVLEKLGLVQALRAHLDSLGQADLILEARESFPRLPMAVEATLYRIAQEAVGNALRHGSPARLKVRLTESADEVRMEIEDDGRGFDPASLTVEGLGLVGMRERAEGLGGALAVHSEPGCGTLVIVLVPREVKAHV